MQKNHLYYGDNLTVLREHIKDESVDLIYLDPPFNSRQDYNVLFAERDGTRSASQIMAFEDTSEWNMDAEAAYEEIVERGGRVSDAMRAFRTLLGHSDMMAYLAMMAPRTSQATLTLPGSSGIISRWGIEVTEELLPKDIRQVYQVEERHHACSSLKVDLPEQWKELASSKRDSPTQGEHNCPDCGRPANQGP
jgi:hypothetical protein